MKIKLRGGDGLPTQKPYERCNGVPFSVGTATMQNHTQYYYYFIDRISMLWDGIVTT